MATALTRLRQKPFTTAETGINMPGGTGGMKKYEYGKGWKKDSNEPFSKQFTYGAILYSGICIKTPNLKPINTYHPTPSDASMPFFGLSDGKWNKTNAILMNRAWADFVEKARVTNLNYGASLAEGRSTLAMIAMRLAQLRRSYKALRRGNFKLFLKELKVKPLRKDRSKVRNAADAASATWLEYWFGWSPLASDIAGGLEFITSHDFWPSGRYFGSAGCRVSGVTPVLPGTGAKRACSFEGSAFAKQGATVKMENYNLFLLNQLGFVNPASVAWERVPFSFVVDWISNVGNVLAGYTDLVGLSIADPYSVSYLRGYATTHYYYKVYNQPYDPCTCMWRAGRVNRGTSLSSPVLLTPDILNFGDSITRAATAASLLVQMFLSKK